MDHHSILKRISLGVALGVLFSMNLWAQDPWKHFTFDVGAGFSFAAGRLADHTETGFNFVASGGPRFNPSLSVGLDFALHYFNVKNSLRSPANGVDFSLGSVVRVWSLTVNPTYQFLRREKYSSYATAGYGLYNRRLKIPLSARIPAAACDSFWNVCISTSTASVSVTGNVNPYTGGYNVGGGVNFGTGTKFFVEGRYHHMFTTNSPTQVIPLTFGVRW
jgi:outer membrane protein with beta-barrel domain